MAVISLGKECFSIARELKRSKDPVIRGELYYLIPRLRDAGRALGRGDPGLCAALSDFIDLSGGAVDRGSLCSFYARGKYGDGQIRKTRYYLILIYCRMILAGKCGVFRLRQIERIDFGSLIADASPLERRLLLYPDYSESDDRTRAEYRRRLSRFAGSGKTDSESALKSLPEHRFTETLFSRDPSPLPYILILISVLITLMSLSALAVGAASLLAVIPLYRLSLYLSSVICGKLLPARICPRVRDDAELPPCLTVITAKLGADISSLAERLGQMRISEGRTAPVLFGILADLPDSDVKYDASDDELISKARGEIDRLNEKYGGGFYLFLRERRYSFSEDAFIAPERKRGAVCELVRQLHTGSSSLEIYGDPEKLRGIPYLITLDSDTVLYPGSVSSLLRCAVHPANRAVVDKKTRTVTKGHGIFQPRIGCVLGSRTDPPFSSVFSRERGTDPYHTPDFDVLSAVFGRGSFCGKGLIDVSAFFTCCCDVFEDGAILSHDAIEGCRCRCGAVTDTVMYESTPKNAISYHKRLERWVRGDVQSLPFTFRYLKRGGVKSPNGLHGVDRFILYGSVLTALAPVFAVICIIYSAFAGALPVLSSIALSYLFVPSVHAFFSDLYDPGRRSADVSYFLFRLSFLFYEAQTVLFAVVRAVFRLIIRKRTLSWTTSSAADSVRHLPSAYALSFLPSVIFGSLITVISSGAAVFTGAVLTLSPVIAYRSSLQRRICADRYRDDGFLLECVKDHMKYFSGLVTAEHGYLPPDNHQVFCGVGTAPRTSPTNIGLYLLSVIAAADLGIYGRDDVRRMLAPTLHTLEKLPKKNGLLYNWYDTHTCTPLSDFVSTVDCGNYLACLITLRQALDEYGDTDDLRETADRLTAECDLTPLYDKQARLFRIGTGDGSDVRYDMYCSEMLTTDVLAIALGSAPPEHFGALSRPVIREGVKKGIASFSGTAFEYFMPALFLPAPEGSAADLARSYAVFRQEKESVRFHGKRVFGMSESCYFAFDADMDYQYKAHGVPGLALHADKRERVISPYSLFLMLSRSGPALSVLRHLKQNGVYGEYGFYEAVDMTRSRTGGGYAVIKCHMAHHIGMSVISAANVMLDDIFVKRFCRDQRVSSVLSLLYEKPPVFRGKKTVGIYSDPPRSFDPGEDRVRDCSLLTNTVCTAVADPYGVGLYFKGACISDENAQGLRGLSVLCGDVDLIRHPASFLSDRVIYGTDDMNARISVCPDEPVFRIDVKADARTALAFEPVMRKKADHLRHTSYSSLFITSSKRKDRLFFSRRGKAGMTVCVAAYGGDGPVSSDVRINGEQTYGKTASELLSDRGITGDFEDTACVFPRVFAAAEPRDGKLTFFISAASDKESASRAIDRAAAGGGDAVSLPPCDTALLSRILRCLMRPPLKTSESSCKKSMTEIIYRHGISGDRPVILLDATGPDGVAGIRAVFPGVASAAVRLLIAGIDADTVILYDSNDGYFNSSYAELCRMIGACGLSALHGSRVFTVPDTDGEKELFRDTAAIVISARDRYGDPPRIPEHDVSVKPERAAGGVPSIGFGAVTVPVGASFAPMSFIYSNCCFGALVTDRSGGFCWYGNSRMFSLTDSDTSPGDRGDRLVFEYNGRRYELFSFSRICRFFPHAAKWSGEIEGKGYSVTLSVDGKAPYKVIKFACALKGTLTYMTVPVLGEKRVGGTLRFSSYRDTATVSRAYGGGYPSLFVRCEGSVSSFDGERLTVRASHAGTTVFTVGAAFNRAVIEYAQSSSSHAAARYLARVRRYLSPFTLHGADPGIDAFFNVYARYQALYCRQLARCGPYQNGGAYGFRDQLQDCVCTVYGEPLLARAHILRCCAHQYEEGDVMHWFHPLTGYGIRTRCSDDMLWLPFAVSEYVRITGDAAILGIKVRYLTSPPLDGERDRYEKAVPSPLRGTVLEHCIRAVSRVRTGEHGLCLMGGGDWNDGMGEAGANGRGESVWLSLFAADVMRRLSALCGDVSYSARADALVSAVEKHGFDGEHYIRGYLDGGEPFGKSGDRVCEIDLMPQAFASLLGLDRERVISSLDAAYDKLYDEKTGLFRLLYPPFDGERGIGYITSYPPGVRENGGQYTHAAVFGAMGFFRAGMNHRGFSVLRSLCPLDRVRSADAFGVYGREPYVLPGDVLTAPGLEGHGGWSWYTGAAGWYFNAVLGYLLGYREHDGGFEIRPAFCAEFRRFTLTVSRRGTEYVISAEDTEKTPLLDGAPTELCFFPFDRGKHTLDIGRKR